MTTKGKKKFWKSSKTEPVDEKLGRYKSNRPRHVTRINGNRVAKIMLNYGPNGRGRLGNRLLDEAERDLPRPNRGGYDDDE